MSFCALCGSRLPEDARFCPSCGGDTTAAGPAVPAAVLGTGRTITPPVRRVLIIVAIVIAGAVFWSLQPSADHQRVTTVAAAGQALLEGNSRDLLKYAPSDVTGEVSEDDVRATLTSLLGFATEIDSREWSGDTLRLTGALMRDGNRYPGTVTLGPTEDGTVSVTFEGDEGESDANEVRLIREWDGWKITSYRDTTGGEVGDWSYLWGDALKN